MKKRSSDDSEKGPDKRNVPPVLHSPLELGRRDLLALVCALGIRGRTQDMDPIFPVAVLDHINIRASNPTQSALFYQGLFGGNLTWIETIPPNPTSPAAESWYLGLGRQFLSISPTFPDLGLTPGLDHISPAVRGYPDPGTAAAKFAQRGIEIVGGSGGWIRDPDGMIYQLRNDANASRSAVPPGQAAPKAGVSLSPEPAPFAPVAIRELTLRVADLDTTAEFVGTVFGGEMISPTPRELRTFRFGDSLLRFIRRAASGPSSRAGMDRFGIALAEFDAESTERELRRLGLAPHDHGQPGEVHFADPDGIQVQLMRTGAAR